MSTIVVAIPTYNEALTIGQTVAELRAHVPEADIVIIDDNSPDGTGALADELHQNDPQIYVLHRPSKAGLAQAYLAAYTWAFERGYTYLVQMDADGSHRAGDLPRLLARAQAPDHVDLVIGSRYTRSGKTEGWSRSRELLSKLGNLYIQLCLGLRIADITAGFRVYRLGFLRTCPLNEIDVVGYFFQTTMTDLVAAHHGHIVEVPIVFAQRRAGESKLSAHIFIESLLFTTKMGIRRRARQLTSALRCLARH